ncbi:hypothetical protein, partial [Neisseria canis]|uniref:hypothetical protein n=1 Tax=Neisseria canis TaxID=493 RepID=UPI001B80B85D
MAAQSTKVNKIEDNYANLASKVGLNSGYIQTLEKQHKEQETNINGIKADLQKLKTNDAKINQIAADTQKARTEFE